MTPAAVRDALATLRLNQTEAARVLCVKPRAVRHYCREGIPERCGPVARLLEVLLAMPDAQRDYWLTRPHHWPHEG